MAITLRLATPNDCRRLFDWRNLPEIVARGSHHTKLIWDEHCAWYASILKSDDNLLVIIYDDAEPIGQIRFDLDSREHALVSIYLHPSQTGRGKGVEAMKMGSHMAFCKWPQLLEVDGLIRTDNSPSIRAFAKAGFVMADGAPVDHVCMRRSRSPHIPHNRLTVNEEDVVTVAKVVRSGNWTSGPNAAALEVMCAKIAHMDYGVAVGSGFAALRLTLHALGVSAGDRVLVPAFSCVALANAALALGAIPIPVEVTENFVIDPGSCVKAIKKHRPSAMIAIHTFGACARIDQLNELGVPVIEDCAHAFGRIANGTQYGGNSRITIQSFHATKLIGAGEGGMILCNDVNLARQVRDASDCSDRSPSAYRMNDRMSDLEAALAMSQIQRLSEFISARERIAKRYLKMLAGIRNITLPNATNRIWYRFVLGIKLPINAVISRMNTMAVCVDRPWPDWRRNEDRLLPTPVADQGYNQLLSLPLYPTLTEAEQDRVVSALVEAINADQETA